MTDSSSVVLLPSTAEVCRTLASSMMVWSEPGNGHKNVRFDFFTNKSSKKIHKQLLFTQNVSLWVSCCFLSGHL